MGCDMECYIEKLNPESGHWDRIEWDKKEYPFYHRNYSVYAFLADVRNYACCPPLSKPKGLPLDSNYLNSDGYDQGWFGSRPATKRDEIIRVDNHSYSYLTLKELLDFDYNKTFEDRRRDGETLPTGTGTKVTFKEFLGLSFFEDIMRLKKLGPPEEIRIIFWFDN